MKIEMNGELGGELVMGVPLAYYYHLQGKEIEIVNVKGSEPFYYFCNFFTCSNQNRGMFLECKIDGDYYYRRHYHSFECLLKSNFWENKWVPPPYSAVFKNNVFVYDKPILVISNKYQTEWSLPPINYIDVETLDELFSMLSKKYYIIYNRAQSKDIVTDNSEILPLGDFELINSKYKNDVHILSDLSVDNISFNQLQMYVYANCCNFISVQGGNSMLTSYFGGKNIVYHKRGDELDTDAYGRWFEHLSGCNVSVSLSYTDLINEVKRTYID